MKAGRSYGPAVYFGAVRDGNSIVGVAMRAGLYLIVAAEARANAERWIAGGRLRLWEDGVVVSMAGASGPTPNGIRVGAVYTPPDKRRRGYASALVAALSQEQLDTGKKFCFLYTDLANPTSNKIYQDVGYEPVCDIDEYIFESA